MTGRNKGFRDFEELNALDRTRMARGKLQGIPRGGGCLGDPGDLVQGLSSRVHIKCLL